VRIEGALGDFLREERTDLLPQDLAPGRQA